ncbi:hypothetical protein [Xanthomonas euvesicatoria]|uniref:hypothetical protein n=1 Tax=Xanthomonas euvesicatoria TaxID=456327 RepID=UPI0026E24060|nr:hypothetical protein [Xanthomonas euvesicatoria]MDO7939130.1 hypothetical protein [Xanthomonas euvesicatoria pv. eucalypti]
MSSPLAEPWGGGGGPPPPPGAGGGGGARPGGGGGPPPPPRAPMDGLTTRPASGEGTARDRVGFALIG